METLVSQERLEEAEKEGAMRTAEGSTWAEPRPRRELGASWCSGKTTRRPESLGAGAE